LTLHNSVECSDRFFINVAPMMNATRHSSFRAQASLAFRCGAALLFGAALVAAQSRPAQINSNKSGKRQHVTTLRSSDSPEGSRVAINSDQSLSDYEAYRRGDRFYVKLPAADVPRAEATRGRGFADVKVQRGADSTVISFRLQPGATAHVEQRSNKLEVVFSAPGTARLPAPGSNAGSREAARTNPAANSAKTPARPVSSPSPAARNAASNTSLPKGSERSGSKLGAASPPPKTIIASASTPTPAPTASPKATPSPKDAAKPTASPGIQPTPATTATSSETTATSPWQNQMKERARYWILLAQLNPIPVVIGAVILALFVLFLLQRRRLKGTRRVRASRSELKKAKTIADAASVQASKSRVEAIADVAAPATMAAAVATSTQPAEKAEPVIHTSPTVQDRARQVRVATVAEQVKNVMAGEEYDPSLIGSDDRETRQLVGAELLSALVGRNLQRRDRARAAFMNHGYFDDATRDLRIADAPVERAAAARRLSFVHDREATPHLIAALDDSAPEVRRTAVEALMDLRDPAAIGPLNSLMQTETDRKVPRTLIKHAIDACATAAAADSPAPSDVSAARPAPQLSATPIEPEREVIEL
jgi:hypothetical protein